MNGRYGMRVLAARTNPFPHGIVFEVAVETSVGSGTPGTFAEADEVPAVADDWTIFVDTAPSDGKRRYVRAFARLDGYTDSAATSVVSVDPWSQFANPITILPHASQHEDGGTDEIDVTDLSGRLADPQNADALNGNPLNAPTPNDGDVLTWDATPGEWVAAAPTGGGGGTRAVGCTFDGAGGALDLLGQTKLRVAASAAGTVSRVQVDTLGGTGSCTVGVKRGVPGGALSDVTGGNDVVVTSDDNLIDTTLSGWSPTHSAFDVYEFELKAVSTFAQITVLLFYS